MTKLPLAVRRRGNKPAEGKPKVEIRRCGKSSNSRSAVLGSDDWVEQGSAESGHDLRLAPNLSADTRIDLHDMVRVTK